MNTNIKLNVGCGSDYKDGFINIDASNSLNRVDKIIDLEKNIVTISSRVLWFYISERYCWTFISLASCTTFDWFLYFLAVVDFEVRVPDTEYIIKSWSIPLRQYSICTVDRIFSGGSVDIRLEKVNFLQGMDGLDLVSWCLVKRRLSLLNSNVGTNIIVTSTK